MELVSSLQANDALKPLLEEAISQRLIPALRAKGQQPITRGTARFTCTPWWHRLTQPSGNQETTTGILCDSVPAANYADSETGGRCAAGAFSTHAEKTFTTRTSKGTVKTG